MTRLTVCASLFGLAGCSVTPQAPQIDAVTPRATCSAAARTELTIRGENLGATVTSVLDEPQVQTPAVRLRPSAPVPGAEQPTESVDVELITWAGAELTVAFDAGDVPLGVYDVGVQPFDGQTTWADAAVAVLADPVVVGIDPPSVCTDAGATALRIDGRGFTRIDGALPTVRIDGEVVAVTAALDCSPLGPDGVEVCEGLQVEVVGTDRPIGLYTVDVTGPPPVDCATASAELVISPPPDVFGVEPAEVCELGGVFTLTGDHITPGVRVYVGGVEATVQSVEPGSVQVLTPQMDVGVYDVTVAQGDACTDTVLDAITVRAQPVTFAVQPETVWSGLASEVRVFVSGYLPAVDEVRLRDAGGDEQPVVFRYEPDSGVVQADIPAGLTPGEYSVVVGVDASCGAVSGATLTVSDDLDIPIEAVNPSFVWQYDARVVEITGPDTLSPGEQPFKQTTSAVLGGPSGTIPLLGLTYRSPDRLTATIPDSLLPGPYDLVLTDADGAIGALTDAVVVTEARPPTIEGVAPNSLSTNGSGLIEIDGTAFDDPTVAVDCLDGGTPSREEATRLTWDRGFIQATVPVASFSGQTICVVEVTNADGAVSRYSAISIRAPSQNLFPFQDGPDLGTARRAPAATAGRTGGTSRFVYALGGDAGTPASALNSVEVASIGVFGDVDPWRYSTPLPEPRTFATAATIRQRVYVVGGETPTDVLDTGVAARILDPLDVPRIQDVDLVRDPAGLSQGRYRYQVAAVYDVTDPNALGLPSEVLPVVIPAGGDAMRVSLAWSAVPQAVAYRIYRDDTGDVPRHVATVTDTIWTDAGAAPVVPSARPLRNGDLGSWRPLPAMNTARTDACIATLDDPGSDPEIVYLYMIGGEDADGTVLDTIEVLDVRIEGPSRHRYGTWRTLPQTLSTPRRGCSAFGISSTEHIVVPADEQWLYVAGGFLAGGTATGTVDAFPIGVQGTLQPPVDVTDMRPSRAGFGAFAASNFFYALGGASGVASDGGVSAELRFNTFPDVRNWNNLGLSLAEPRLYMGLATESAVAIVIGGADSTATPTTSTEWTRF